MEIQLAYGLRNGHVVHISEIKPDEKGLKCNCVCPNCRGALEARIKDDKRQRHFAHPPNSKCNVSHAQQTGLHRLAKEIIQENKSILVPGLYITRKDIISDHHDSSAAQVEINLPEFPATIVDYSSVEIEKAIGNIVADAVIYINEKPCIVEIAVTHFVDDDKKRKIEALNHLAFEIDLSDLLGSPQTRESITAAVLSDETKRKWIYNPKRERLLAETKAEFQIKLDKKLDDDRRAREREELRRKNDIIAMQKLMEPENYANELKRLRNDKQAQWRLNSFFRYPKELTEYPFFMDIPITGEFVFSCDRRIWQGALFNDYVYWGFGFELCEFSIYGIHKRISKGHLFIKYDLHKTYKTELPVNGKDQEVYFPLDVIRRYFEYLELLGFVSRDKFGLYSKRPVSLEPPNQAAAIILQDILNSVDRSSPNIDKIIQDELNHRMGENAFPISNANTPKDKMYTI